MKSKNRTRFPISFWNYIPFPNTKPNAVDNWTDLGMTEIQGPSFSEGCDPAAMLALLDACEARGLRVLLRDYRADAYGSSDDPEAYEKHFREAYEQFGKHPAVVGFFVCDEPHGPKAFNDVMTAHAIQLKVAPELTPYLNFVPFADSAAPELMEVLTGEEHPHAVFTDCVRVMKERCGLRILSCDCYGQMLPRGEGVDMYFQTLRTFENSARAVGCDPWFTILCVGHFRFRCPSEDDLRWQLSTAVASGMKGILWFHTQVDFQESNYRNHPINEFGERTETFTWLSRVNRKFNFQYGEFFARAVHCKTYHHGHAWGGFEKFVPYHSDPDLLNITSVSELDTVVGFFEYEGSRCVAIVNNSWEESGEFRVHVKKDAPLDELDWYGKFVPTRTYGTHRSENDEEFIGGDFLAPGQMKVYRL